MVEVDAALLIIRVGLGVVFLAHGVKHARGRLKTSNWFASIGFRAPQFNWFTMTITELAIGVLLIFGALTTLGVAMLVGTMFVAFWSVHRKAGFWITARPDEGWEYALILSLAAVALAMAGPGELSIDHALEIADDFDGTVGLAAAVAGVGFGVGTLAAFYRPKSSAE